MKAKVNKVTIQVLNEDIMSIDVEAIVNDTSPILELPVSWSTRVGQALQQDLHLIGFCDIGSAILTHAGELPHLAIIHAVGPKWGEPAARGQLAKATWQALELAEGNKLKSIAFPPLSTGSNGYPIENCATTMLREIIDFTFEPLKYVRKILISASTDIAFDTFSSELSQQIESLRNSDNPKVQV